MKSLPNFIIVGPIDIFCKQKHFDLTKTTKIGWSTVNCTLHGFAQTRLN